MRTTTANPQSRQRGSSLVEMLLLISITGALLLLTVRVLHLATKVHESAISTATHLRLVTSLEDRLHSDIAQAQEAASPSPGQLHLVMHEQVQVHYQLTKPNLVERITMAGDSTKPVVNQRWLFTCDWEMNTELNAKDTRTLVRMRLKQSTLETASSMLRAVEVSEVTGGQ